jgi:diamine N-acetyltransferase
MRVLESERIVIKPVEQDDLQYLLELRWDESIMSQLVHNPISMKNQVKWFEGLDNQKNVACVIFFKEGDKISRCGTVGLYNINQLHRRGTWRLRIDPEFQGKGIGSESTRMIIEYGFNTLNLNKIISDSFVENQAIVKLSLKLGFNNEGCLKEHYYQNGKYRDVYQFGITKGIYKP